MWSGWELVVGVSIWCAGRSVVLLEEWMQLVACRARSAAVTVQ